MEKFRLLVKKYILNKLDNTIYGVYCGMKTAKELWLYWEKKLKRRMLEWRNSSLEKFFGFKMVDSKTIISLMQEIHVIIHHIHDKGVTISETF